MPFDSYGSLKAAVLSFNWARDAGSVEDFIRLAHARINLNLRAPFMEKTADLTINAPRVVAPADLAAVTRLWIDDAFDTPLRPTSPDRLQALAAEYSSGGRPQYFAIEGESDSLEYFVFAPAPVAPAAFTGKLLYTRRLAYFASDGATNVVLDRYPNLYLYGALWEAALFSDDEPRVAKYAPMFAGLVREINTQTRQLDAMSGGSPAMTSPYVV